MQWKNNVVFFFFALQNIFLQHFDMVTKHTTPPHNVRIQSFHRDNLVDLHPWGV